MDWLLSLIVMSIRNVHRSFPRIGFINFLSIPLCSRPFPHSTYKFRSQLLNLAYNSLREMLIGAGEALWEVARDLGGGRYVFWRNLLNLEFCYIRGSG